MTLCEAIMVCERVIDPTGSAANREQQFLYLAPGS